MTLRWLGRVLKGGLRALEDEDEHLESRYCAVCECELQRDGRWWLESPNKEVIEVCAACFDTRPEDYKPLG